METMVVSVQDRRSGRWLEAGRDGRRIEVRAGTTRTRAVGRERSRRTRHTTWQIVGAASGPTITLITPVRRSAAASLGGAEADLRRLLQTSGAADDADAELALLSGEIVEVLDYPTDGPGHAHGLTGVLTGAIYPLLDASMANGCPPPPAVPAPVGPYLKAPTARDAAVRAFGRRANRPVVRALAASLTPADGDAPALEPLATAVLGTPVLPPERIADLLRARPTHPGAVMLGARDVATGQELLTALHPTVAFRLLVEAVEAPEGPGLLVEALTRWALVGRPEPPPRVRSLRALLDAFEAMPLRHPPAPARADEPVGAVERIARAFDAPVPRQHAAPGDPYPTDLRALHGRQAGRFVIDVPTGGHDLLAWGREMGNCLGSYREAVDRGLSHLLGYRVEGRLEYAVELSRDRWVRQFEGRAGARPTRADSAVIIGDLQRAGVLDRHAARRAPGRRLAPPI